MIALLTILLVPSLQTPGSADSARPGSQEREPQASLARQADGSPVCGLGRDFHAGRRALLRKELEHGVFVMRGLPATRDYRSFHQDKVFWYLTGVESVDAALVMDLDSGREVLFLPDGNPGLRGMERWEGEIWDSEDEWVSELTGFAEVEGESRLLEVLDEFVGEGGRVLWTSLAPHVELGGSRDRAGPHDRRAQRDPLDGRPSREGAFSAALDARYGVVPKGASPYLDRMRLIKTDEEVAALRRAASSGALAMIEAIRSTRPGLGEWDLDALMTWMQVRTGARGPAYHAIVGSGPNSCVLHYSSSNRRMREGEVVLIDYGPEVDHYTTDITRTWPVSGSFDERQAEMYDAVLAAQMAGIDAVRPGTTMGAVTNACRRSLAQANLSHLMPHGACHWVGLEVHDAGDNSARLAPGMVFTIEPGVYDPEIGVGIRIEDVVLVTPEGCEVLTAGVPKERAQLEALVRSSGILDRLDDAED